MLAIAMFSSSFDKVAFKARQKFELTLVHNNNNRGRKHFPSWRKNSQPSFFLQIVEVVIHIQNYQPWILLSNKGKKNYVNLIDLLLLLLWVPMKNFIQSFISIQIHIITPLHTHWKLTIAFVFRVPKTIIAMVVELPSKYKTPMGAYSPLLVCIA